MNLAERACLWTGNRQAAAREVERGIQAGLSVVRLSFADQHGILRGKTLVATEVAAALRNGVGFTTTMLLKDTSHRTVFPVWTPGGGFGMKELEGAADVMMLPDPSSFRVLPWAPHTGWMLCDILFADGRPMPLSTRQVCRQVCKTVCEPVIERVCVPGKTVCVDGCWVQCPPTYYEKTVYRPRAVTETVSETVMERQVISKQVPFTIAKQVPVTTQRTVPVTCATRLGTIASKAGTKNAPAAL